MAYEPPHQPTVVCKLKHAETNHSTMSGGQKRRKLRGLLQNMLDFHRFS